MKIYNAVTVVIQGDLLENILHETSRLCDLGATL